MLKRSKRIQGKDRSTLILKEGNGLSNSLFVIKSMEGRCSENRYAVLVGRKLLASAAKRNKKRRQVYEILRLMEKEGIMAKCKPSDIVILARRPAALASFDQLNTALRALIAKFHEKN